MMEWCIIGQQGSSFAAHCARVHQMPLISFSINRFADTECFVQFHEQEYSWPEVQALLVWEFNKNTSLNDQILSLLLLVDTVKQMGVQDIIGIFPYLPYTRQEKSMAGDYQGPIFLVKKLLALVGVDPIITCDIHSQALVGQSSVTLYNISTAPLWEEHIKQVCTTKNIVNDSVCIVSPDHGGIARAQDVATCLGCGFAYLEKERIALNHAVTLSLHGDVSNKIIFIIDDIIDTGHTAINAAKLLRENGAQEIYGCFTHALLSGDAAQKIQESFFDHIWVTDTICSTLLCECSQKISLRSSIDFLAQSLQKIQIFEN